MSKIETEIYYYIYNQIFEGITEIDLTKKIYFKVIN